MRVLGIESSCDETAAAVVEDGHRLLSNAVASSMDIQAKYGGVVPEIAARSHIESITPIVEQALSDAKCTWDDIDAIAVTYGAGLGGCLLVGVMTARTLSITKNKPLYAINHVEAHVYANFLTSTSLSNYEMPSQKPEFPLLALIVSGGHSQLVLFRDHFDYTLLGQTQDDAIGEAFDKVAKILGLPYPGGPSIAQIAKKGDPHAFTFPKAKVHSINPALEELRQQIKTTKAPRLDVSQGVNKQQAPGSSIVGLSADRGESEHATEPQILNRSRLDVSQGVDEQRNKTYPAYVEGVAKKTTKDDAKSNSGAIGATNRQTVASSGIGYDYSFSGPKTAVLRAVQKLCGKSHDFPSFKLAELLTEAQKADIAASFQRTAVETVVDKAVLAYEEFQPKSVVIGGGVAASPELRKQLQERLPLKISYADPKLCTDNGAMIATLGCFKANASQPTADPYSLDIKPNLSM